MAVVFGCISFEMSQRHMRWKYPDLHLFMKFTEQTCFEIKEHLST